jgi:hypothetical protein
MTTLFKYLVVIALRAPTWIKLDYILLISPFQKVHS